VETTKFADELRYTLEVILREDLQCIGTVSLMSCLDVIEHHGRDIDRLYAFHQELVHPSKHIAYAAFWIRKLKPVGSSFPIAEVERAALEQRPVNAALEVRDVNERICLYYTFRLLTAIAKRDVIKPTASLTRDQFIAKIRRAFDNFLAGADLGPMLGDRFQAIVYDMRYRTFGPHHVVHLVNYLLSEASYGSD
jgi:hypothetical protein